MFKKLMNLALVALGIAEFPTKDGKVNFSEEQKSLLEKEFAGQLGADFVANFEAAINKHLEDTTAKEESEATKQLMENIKTESQEKIKKLSSELSEMKKKQEEADAKIAKLQESAEDEPGALEEEQTAKVVKFKPNMQHVHNARAAGFLGGKEDLGIAATTIDVTEMKSEFGAFMSQFNIKLEMIKKLTAKTESEQYMTTKFAVDSWKASQALITSVVQQFSSKWTPLGQSSFTPIEIKNYRHKINVPITPDEIMDSWLGYMYDEGLTPDAMPITKYIIEELIVPKVLEDRELRLIGKGEYTALGAVATGDPGQATGKSMDGFCTTLKKEKASGTSAINFIDLGVITDANIVDKVNEFVDAIDELYKGVPMNIHCSFDTYRQYKRAYQKLYPTTKGVDKNEDMVDFSLNRLVPLPSMSGEHLFFATPKENFVRLQHKNNGASKIWMQAEDYDVKVFAEWWEGVGFAIGEAVFAYVPDEGSSSGS